MCNCCNNSCCCDSCTPCQVEMPKCKCFFKCCYVQEQRPFCCCNDNQGYCNNYNDYNNYNCGCGCSNNYNC